MPPHRKSICARLSLGKFEKTTNGKDIVTKFTFMSLILEIQVQLDENRSQLTTTTIFQILGLETWRPSVLSLWGKKGINQKILHKNYMTGRSSGKTGPFWPFSPSSYCAQLHCISPLTARPELGSYDFKQWHTAAGSDLDHMIKQARSYAYSCPFFLKVERSCG